MFDEDFAGLLPTPPAPPGARGGPMGATPGILGHAELLFPPPPPLHSEPHLPMIPPYHHQVNRHMPASRQSNKMVDVERATTCPMMARVVFGEGLTRTTGPTSERGLTSLSGVYRAQEVLQLGGAPDVSYPVWGDTCVGDLVHRALRGVGSSRVEGVSSKGDRPFMVVVHAASRGIEQGDVYGRLLKRLRFRSINNPVRDGAYNSTLNGCLFHSGVVLLLEVEAHDDTHAHSHVSAGGKRPRMSHE